MKKEAGRLILKLVLKLADLFKRASHGLERLSSIVIYKFDL